MLQDALKKLKEAAEDLTSLHVQTYSGTITFDYDDKEGFDNIREKLKNLNEDGDGGSGDGSSVSGEVQLVAESLHKFDGDSYQFFADAASKQLRDTHNKAVKNGMDTRLALLEMFQDALLE